MSFSRYAFSLSYSHGIKYLGIPVNSVTEFWFVVKHYDDKGVHFLVFSDFSLECITHTRTVNVV